MALTTRPTAPVTGWRRFTNDGQGREPFLTKRTRRWWYGFLAVCILPGLWALWERMTNGLVTTDLTSQMPWGAWVAFYIFFVGLSVGSYMLSSLEYVFRFARFDGIGRPALVTALISIFIGLAFIGMDLGRLDRAVSVLAHFHWTSPLSWEVGFYVIYVVLLLAQLVLALRLSRHLAKDRPRVTRWLRGLGIAGLPLAVIGVQGGEGTLFAVVKARGMWFGGLFPIVFVVSAVVSGAALLLAVHFWRSRGARQPVNHRLVKGLAAILLGAVLTEMVFTFYEFAVPLLAYQRHDGDIIELQMTGPYAWTFWGMQIGIGLLAPAIILLSPLRRRVGWMVASAMLVLVGILGLRFNLVVPPLIPPVIEGYPANDYFPTVVEWLISLLFIAGAGLVYSLVAEWQPIHETGHDAGDQQEVSA